MFFAKSSGYLRRICVLLLILLLGIFARYFSFNLSFPFQRQQIDLNHKDAVVINGISSDELFGKKRLKALLIYKDDRATNGGARRLQSAKLKFVGFNKEGLILEDIDGKHKLLHFSNKEDLSSILVFIIDGKNIILSDLKRWKEMVDAGELRLKKGDLLGVGGVYGNNNEIPLKLMFSNLFFFKNKDDSDNFFTEIAVINNVKRTLLGETILSFNSLAENEQKKVLLSKNFKFFVY